MNNELISELVNKAYDLETLEELEILIERLEEIKSEF
jgi:hypothetical protein